MDREYAIKVIRDYLYYRDGELEAMTDEELREVYEKLIDWLEG